MNRIYSSLLFLFTLTSLQAQVKKTTNIARRPNIIIILADDLGYSDLGCFGSEIRTPNLDAMAERGLVMTNFYNASRCCPTRASLLTGLYQHQAGVGHMVNSYSQPAYQGYLNKNCVTIAEALKAGGYNTFMAGKWHIGSSPQHWPDKRGFDRYYGLIDGASSYFKPTTPYRPNQHLTLAMDGKAVTEDTNFYATDAYATHALNFIEESKGSNKPFFLYMAFTSPHWPLHALPEDIAKYKGKYLAGWDKVREHRLQKMKKSGILQANATLSPRDPHVADWNTLSDVEKKEWDDHMSVYAAMVDRMDQNIGKIKIKLKELNEDQNTVIIFLSDNGASSEYISGTSFTPGVQEASKKPASDPTSFTSYGFEGANVSNTPFRLFKRSEYEGGTATPFIISYPGAINQRRIDHRPAHIIDIMSTCLDLAHVPYPKTFNGNKIKSTEGISLLPVIKGKKWKRHNALFFEHEGNRAVRKGDWKLVSQYPANKWELYNIKTDRLELNDLSLKYQKKVKIMEALYLAWAERAEVIPFEQLDKHKTK